MSRQSRFTPLDEYVNHIEHLIQTAYNFQPEHERPRMIVETGRKYFKVVTDYGNQRSVHSFVEKATGDLYKAASWNAPAKDARFNLLRDMEKIKQVADPYGGYLYKR